MGKKNNIRISVLVLSYNHRDFVEACIRSALSQQSDKVDIEVIVIDDGSNDGTVRVLEKISNYEKRVRFIPQAHQGVKAIAHNFNRLIQLATGDYVAFLASDDEFLPNCFLKQIEVLERESEVQLVYSNGLNRTNGVLGNNVIRQSSSAALHSENPELVYNYVIRNVPLIFIQGILIRRKFFDGFLPFDDDLIADDWVFNINVFRKLMETDSSFRFYDEPIFIRNRLSTRTSANLRIHWERINQVVDRYVPMSVGFSIKTKKLKKYIKRAIRNSKFQDTFYFLVKIATVYLYCFYYFINRSKDLDNLKALR